VVDKDRNAVSFITSISDIFGSGMVAGDSGIILHKREILAERDEMHLVIEREHRAVMIDNVDGGMRVGAGEASA
jgi:gamma-glutamyltranspeptidase